MKSFQFQELWVGGTRPSPRGTLPPPEPTDTRRMECTCTEEAPHLHGCENWTVAFSVPPARNRTGVSLRDPS